MLIYQHNGTYDLFTDYSVINLPAVDNDGFISSVLLCSDDLIDEVDHPRPSAWSSTLWPRGEVKLLNHSVLAVSRLYGMSTEIKAVKRMHVGWLLEQ